jgi:methylglutaconyl-CoA hydratase
MTFLRRQLRERDLRELLLMSELIEAERAQEIGLVNRVVPPDELEATAQTIATAILQGAPAAITNSKRLMDELWSSSVAADIALALRHHMEARESDEAKEGIAAFLEKRPPKWVG